jgi:membrane dipeptidase
MDRRDFMISVGASALATGTSPGEEKRKTYRVIDTHLHLFNTRLQGQKGVPVYMNLDATVEAAVVAMDRGGVAKAFLISYAAEDVAVQIRQRAFRPELLREVISKEYQVKAWRAHKKRFWWFTDHIDPMRKTYREDLLRDFEAGASGIKMLPWFHGVLPVNPGYIPIYELCQKHKKPVILDLSWWYFHLNPLFNEPAGRRKLVRSFADYARLLSPLFRRFDRVPFSLAHCGTARNEKEYDEIFGLIAAHPNVSCDVAAATGYSVAFLEKLVRAVGAHKVMYGTDWPYWSAGPESYLTGSRRWRIVSHECRALTERDKQLILAGNAERFVGFQLPDAVGDRAHALHKDSIVVVMHDHNPIGPDVPLMRSGGVTAKVYQLAVDVEIGKNFRASADRRDGWQRRAQRALHEACQTIASSPDRLLLALTAADIRRAKKENKIAILLGTEGGKLLEGRLETLRAFYKLGLRELQLRWAVPNALVEKDELTAFGRAVVHECQKLGIIVDLTHIPEKAFFQVTEMSKKPLIASHETGRSLGVKRMKAIAAGKGVIGVHFYTSYLGERPTVLQVLDAVDFIARHAGIQTVGLGIDFFPTTGPWQDFQQAQGTRELAWAIPNLSHLEEVTRALVARSYSDQEIRGILGENYLRVCRDVFGS